MYEEYKDIPGYEGLYKINRNGDIVSFNGPGKKPRLRAHSIHVDRHFIMLSKGGINKRFPVANLVAETFRLPNPNGYKTIAFKDGNFHNLSLDNLEWAPLSKARKEISPEARARAAATLRAMGHKPTEKVLNALRRKIAAYDDDGNWVASFRSVADANKIVGGSIGQALIKGCRAGGYYWKYVEDTGGTNMHEPGNVRRQCAADGRKERLIDVLAQLNLEDLTLTMATGLNCDHCPVAAEQGKCYDKTICFRTMIQWLEDEKEEK